jgi:hypothetical protein
MTNLQSIIQKNSTEWVKILHLDCSYYFLWEGVLYVSAILTRDPLQICSLFANLKKLKIFKLFTKLLQNCYKTCNFYFSDKRKLFPVMVIRVRSDRFHCLHFYNKGFEKALKSRVLGTWLSKIGNV